ncbi:hypothetical protein PISMIDRAFT_682141, partial [Pisolithus microcarpus 441]
MVAMLSVRTDFASLTFLFIVSMQAARPLISGLPFYRTTYTASTARVYTSTPIAPRL